MVDANAKVTVDLPTRRVTIASAEGRDDFVQALTDAGYPPA